MRSASEQFLANQGRPVSRLNRFVSANAPVLFVLLWNTGYIGAKYGLPYAEPFTLLFLRFVLALSLGAILLLTWLIKHGEASKVSSLFYLVPPVTAVVAWLLFGEPLGWIKAAGIALVALGVWMVMRRKAW